MERRSFKRLAREDEKSRAKKYTLQLYEGGSVLCTGPILGERQNRRNEKTAQRGPIKILGGLVTKSSKNWYEPSSTVKRNIPAQRKSGLEKRYLVWTSDAALKTRHMQATKRDLARETRPYLARRT